MSDFDPLKLFRELGLDCDYEDDEYDKYDTLFTSDCSDKMGKVDLLGEQFFDGDYDEFFDDDFDDD